MKNKTEKIQIKQAAKSKMTSVEWHDVGNMMQALQSQERMWIDAIAEKQLNTGMIVIGYIPDELSLKEIKAKCKNAKLLLAYVNEELAGYCSLTTNEELDCMTCNWLYVKKEHRRKGVATALLKFALDLVHSEKLSSLDLRVSSMNDTALNLYKKLGFSPTAYMLEKWVR